METRNFGVLDNKSYLILRTIMPNANVKYLRRTELLDAGYEYNPFGEPDYWILVNTIELKKRSFKPQDGYETLYAYKNLITLQEFKELNLNQTYQDILNFFLDWSGTSHSVLGHLRCETFNQFVDRCNLRFNSNFIYRVTPRLAKEEERICPNEKSLILLKDLAVEASYELEKHHCFNYIILPDFSRLDSIIADLQDADHSWGSYDPYGI